MKKLIIALTLIAFTGAGFAATVQTKRVCRDVKQKNGTVVKQCKTIKIHKKLNGRKVPPKTR